MAIHHIKQFLNRDRTGVLGRKGPEPPPAEPAAAVEATASPPAGDETGRQAPAPSAPPVAQMAALLRATLQHRRDTVAIMQDLASPLSAQTIQMVEVMRQKLPARHVFQTRPLVWLQDHLRGQGRAFHPFMLAALCMLLDMESGKLSSDDLDAAVMGSRPVETSWEAVNQVARFEGVTLDPRAWKEKFDRAGLPFPARGEPRVFEKMVTALALIEERMSVRDPRAVLANLVRDCPSPRVETVVRVWRNFHPRQAGTAAGTAPPTLEVFEAYRQWMAALGVRMDPSTLLAFCLYSEIEAGRISPDRFLQWLAGSARLTLSPYTMQAVAAALDLEFLAVSLPLGHRVLKAQLLALLALSPSGLLQGMVRTDAPDRVYRYLAHGSDVDAAPPPGWKPSGELLLRPAIMDRIGADDLRLILSLGTSVLAAFQSDQGGSRVWRLLTPETAEPAGPVKDGAGVYRFQGRILADLSSATAGARPASSPEIWQDPRGSLHLRAPGGPPLTAPLEKLELAIHFPSLAGLPEQLPELPLESLLGTVEPGAGDGEKIELLSQALGPLLAPGPELGPSLAARGLRAMLEALEAPRTLQTLRPVVDSRTLEHVKQGFLNPDKSPVEFHMYPPIMPGLKYPEIVEYVSLALVYELCVSELTASAGLHQSFDRHWFRAALRNHLLICLEAADAQVRGFGCRLLCTASCVGDNNERLIVEYELKKQIESEDRALAREAAASLARLALEERIPLPQLWVLRSAQAAPSSPAARGGVEREVKVAEVMDEIRAWHARVSAMLGLATPPAPSRPGAPTAARAPISEAMLEMSRVLAGARACLAEERKAGRRPADTCLLLATNGFLTGAVKALVASFRERAEAEGLSLQEAAQRLSGEADLKRYLDPARGLRWLEGANPAELRAWKWAEVAESEPLWILRGPAEGGKVSPLFAAYVELAVEHGADGIRLGRLAAGDGPSALEAEVFDYRSGAFVPFLEEMRIASQLFLPVAEQELLVALAGPASDRKPEPASQSAPRRRDRAIDAATVRSLASSILAAFQIGEGFRPQVVHLLEEAAAAQP